MGNAATTYSKAVVDYYKQAVKLPIRRQISILEELDRIPLHVQGNQFEGGDRRGGRASKAESGQLAGGARMLGHIYTQMIGDTQQGKINEEMVKKSIEQYQIITKKDQLPTS